ncbi:MAG: phosphotransferase family protein [Rhodoferax sp.]|nr:phosphotransferase family protein [Rhodoferax sp.]
MSEADDNTGTRQVPAHHQVDTSMLCDWLESQIPGFRGPISLELFKGGQSNPTYKLSTPTQHYVMRSKPGPVARLLPSAHAIEREFLVMRSLKAAGIPVPNMLVLCEDESVIGRAFYLMEFLDGRVLWDQSLPGMAPASRTAIYDAMNGVIAALHRVNPALHGLAGYGKPGNYFERQIGRWSKQYAASAIHPIPEMDRLIEWLPAHIPPMARNPDMVSVVHGDYRLDNVMFAHDAPQVIAVLDWELSTLGHPLADFSYHCMSWHIEPGAFRGLAGLDLKSLGIPTEDDYIHLYCDRTGLATPQELQAEWNFYLAYNLFRLAAILQGVAKRAQIGIASSAQAERTASGVHALARLAWHFAQRH